MGHQTAESVDIDLWQFVTHLEDERIISALSPESGPFVSYDRGVTWIPGDGIPSIVPGRNTFSKFWMSPSDPDHLYMVVRTGVFTQEGLFTSVDGGRHWILRAQSESLFMDLLAVGPRDSNVLYAYLRRFGERSLAISNNGGATWTDLAPAPGASAIASLSLAASGPTIGYSIDEDRLVRWMDTDAEVTD